MERFYLSKWELTYLSPVICSSEQPTSTCVRNMSSEGRRFLPLGMTEASVLNSLRRHSAADCFTTSRVSLQDSSSLTSVPSIFCYSPRDEKFRNFHSKSLRHVLAANVSNALEGQRHVDWVPAGQVILDALNYQLDQLRVAGYQY